MVLGQTQTNDRLSVGSFQVILTFCPKSWSSTLLFSWWLSRDGCGSLGPERQGHIGFNQPYSPESQEVNFSQSPPLTLAVWCKARKFHPRKITLWDTCCPYYSLVWTNIWPWLPSKGKYLPWQFCFRDRWPLRGHPSNPLQIFFCLALLTRWPFSLRFTSNRGSLS